MTESLEHLIYTISPAETPVIGFFRYARIEFQATKGGSMRQQRRRKAKPIRFTARYRFKPAQLHEWVVDTIDSNRTHSAAA